MTSLLCIQEPGGYVEHNHKEYTQDVIRDSSNHAIFAKYFPDDKVRPRYLNKRPFSTPNPQIDTDNLDRQRLMGHSMKLQAWLNEKSVKHIQEKSDSEAKPVKEMYGAVLDREDTFVKGLQDYCDKHEFLNRRKKEILHKNWSERVYEPIRKAIIDQMDNSDNYNRYKLRKDQLYREYVEHLNRKGHVFRDDYDPSEYYATGLHADRPAVVMRDNKILELTRRPNLREPILPGLQANTERLRDPTLLQESHRNKEDQLILKCSSGIRYDDRSLDKVRLPTLPLAPQGRHGTENDTWIAMHLSDIESDARKASSKDILPPPRYISRYGRELPTGIDIDEVKIQRMIGTNLKSEINFGNWSVQKYGKDTTDAEMGIPKRKHCRQPPFTAPKIMGVARKRLPAAKESHRSRTLPVTNMKYLDYELDYPFDVEMPQNKSINPSVDMMPVGTHTYSTIIEEPTWTETEKQKMIETLQEADVVF